MDRDTEKRKIYLEEERPIIEFPTLVVLAIAFSAFCVGLSLVFLPWQIALFLFLGLCLAIAVFLNLYVGILIFLIGAFFHPTYWFPALQELHLARNLAFGILFIWGLHTIIYRDFRLIKAPQNFLIIAFFSLGFATTFKAFDLSFPYFLEFSSKAMVLYFAIVNVVRKRKEVIFLIWFIAGISFVLALIGIYQYTHNIGVYYPAEGLLRVRGLAEDPNLFAMDLVISLPIVIGLFFCYRLILVRAIGAGIISVLIVTTILTFSRAGAIQLMSALFFSLGVRIFKKRKFLGVLTFVAALVIFIPLIPQKYWARIQTTTKFSDPAVDMRLVGWKVGLEMMRENFFTGVGFGMFRPRFFEKAISSAEIPYKQTLDAHNVFIHTGAEMGIGGLLLLLLLLFFTFKNLRQAKKIFYERKDSFLTEISSALEVSLVVYLLGGIFISYLVLLIFWIIVPLAVVLKQLSIEQQV